MHFFQRWVPSVSFCSDSHAFVWMKIHVNPGMSTSLGSVFFSYAVCWNVVFVVVDFLKIAPAWNLGFQLSSHQQQITPMIIWVVLGKPHYLSVGRAGNNRGANEIGRREKVGGDKFWTTPGGGGRKILDFPRRGAKNFTLDQFFQCS